MEELRNVDTDEIVSRDDIEPGFTYEWVEGYQWECFVRDDELWGAGPHGEFRINGGSKKPVEEDDFDYPACGAVMKFWRQRYGERRYCTALTWVEFCRHHKMRKGNREVMTDNFETGAFVQSYKTLWQNLDSYQKVICIESFHNLMEESRYEFDADIHVETIDVSDIEWSNSETWDVDFPIPKKNVVRARHLWMASVELCKMENIQEKLIQDAAEGDHGVGERESVVAVTEDGNPITDMEEHHLNLPLSRIIKDHSNLLDIGGVDYGSEDSDMTINVNDRQWVTAIEEPDDPQPGMVQEENPFDKNVDE